MSKELSKAARWIGKSLKDMVNDYQIKQLIDQAYSKDPKTRAIARAKLKKEYPDIYSELDFTEEKKNASSN